MNKLEVNYFEHRAGAIGTDLTFTVQFKPDPDFEIFNLGMSFEICKINRQTGDVTFTTNLGRYLRRLNRQKSVDSSQKPVQPEQE